MNKNIENYYFLLYNINVNIHNSRRAIKMKIIIIIIILILILLLSILTYFKEHKLIAVFIFLFGIFLDISIGFLFNINNIKQPSSSSDVNTTTISTTASTNKSNFVHDYRPGKQNVFGNMTYSNNGGMVAVQDETYYIGNNKGIYKTNDFKKFIPIYNCEAYSLNVVGDYIYFTDYKNLYEIKTDGTDKKTLLSEKNISNVQVYDKYIYFIGDNDCLYRYDIGSSKKIQLSKDKIGNYALDGANVLYIDTKISKEDDGTISYEPLNLKMMFDDGTNPSFILKKKNYDPNKDDDKVNLVFDFDICYYSNNFYIGKYTNGVHSICKVDSYNKISSIKNNSYGHSFCIFNNYLYYSRDTQNKGFGNIYRMSLKTNKNKTEYLGKPFDKEYQISYFYPIDDEKMILSIDCETFYLWNHVSNKLEEINFNNN